LEADEPIQVFFREKKTTGISGKYDTI